MCLHLFNTMTIELCLHRTTLAHFNPCLHEHSFCQSHVSPANLLTWQSCRNNILSKEGTKKAVKESETDPISRREWHLSNNGTTLFLSVHTNKVPFAHSFSTVQLKWCARKAFICLCKYVSNNWELICLFATFAKGEQCGLYYHLLAGLCMCVSTEVSF